MELNLKSLLPIGLIILAVMFVMKMMKGSRRCEGFSEQKNTSVDCNCNINENFANEPQNEPENESEEEQESEEENPTESTPQEKHVHLEDGANKVKNCIQQFGLNIDSSAPTDADVVKALSDKCLQEEGALKEECINNHRDQLTACITKNDNVELQLEKFNNITRRTIEHFEQFGNVENFSN
jgi:hypothetical protein